MVEYNSLSFLIQTCVALACALGGIAAIGSFNCLQRKELVGDVVAHSLLPGIGAALLLVGEKAAIPFLIGAFLSGFCSIFTISWIQRSTKVGEDAALGLVIAFFFGLGLVVTSYIQRYGGEGNAGWSQQYLLGSTASITYGDMAVFVIFALLLLVLIFFCFKEWRLIV
ncbi:MAG: metal ABC transporter permease, partial [Cytophagales bacterium]